MPDLLDFLVTRVLWAKLETQVFLDPKVQGDVLDQLDLLVHLENLD